MIAHAPSKFTCKLFRKTCSFHPACAILRAMREKVLAMVSPMSAARIAGIARYAHEQGWHLMIQDRLGYHPLAWDGNGVIAALRSDPVSVDAVRRLMKRGIPVVDLTISRPDIKVPRVMSDHTATTPRSGASPPSISRSATSGTSSGSRPAGERYRNCGTPALPSGHRPRDGLRRKSCRRHGGMTGTPFCAGSRPS